MAQKVSLNRILISTLAVTALLLSIAPVWPVRAGGGVVLRPPFNGTYRVTAYFDHHHPNYSGDNEITIYTGEPVSNCSPYCYHGHDGWDWSMGTGTAVLAAAAGTVVLSTDDWGGSNSCYGRTIVIDHGNGYYTQYSHLSNRLVSGGVQVAAGQHIANSGDSVGPGCNPVGAHLHFGVRHGGYANTTYATDPFGWRGSYQDPLVNFPTTGAGHTASCLWSGVPGDDISCADIIVEDDGAGWTELGTWYNSTNGNGYREHHTYSWNYPSSYAYWMPTLPARGYYQVYAFVPPISSRTTHAPYYIDSGVFQQTVYGNQSGAAPRWMFLTRGEFRAGAYGWVRLHDYTGESQYSHWVAADGMKFSASVVYLPEVRNSGGWVSSIVVRNNSVASLDMGINYYNTGGGLSGYQTVAIGARGAAVITPPSGFSGSAVVIADQDVSVVVRNTASNKVTSYTGVSAQGSGAGWDQPGTTAYVPAALRNYYGWNSELYIQNTGSGTASGNVRFYNANGGLRYSYQ